MRSKRVAFFVVIAAALPLFACEQILNLDQWSLSDGSIPTPDASDATASDVIIIDAPLDTFQLPDGATEASSWAHWRMVNTLAEVLDGAPEASLPQFAVTDAGIGDPLTGLVWGKPVAPGAMSFPAAVSACATINMRLPTRIELVTLIDTTRATSPFVANAFTNTYVTSSAYWTSSYVRPIQGNNLNYWFVDFTTGDVLAGGGSGDVVCVR